MSKIHLHSHRSSRAIFASAGVIILTVLYFSVVHFQSRYSDTHSVFDTSDTSVKLGGLVQSGSRVRQATVALQNEYDPVFERAMKSHIRHGDLWGYPTHILRYTMLEVGSGYSQFNKISFLQMLLLDEMAKPYGQRAGWIAWFNADTVLLNPKVPWTAFLPPTKFPNIHYLATKDWNGFNAGVFLIRVHEWSIKMLTDAQALPSLRPEISISFEDQGAMLEIFSRPEYRDSVVFQPHDWWNRYLDLDVPQSVQPGDMLIHFAGMGDKAGSMGPWLDRVENVANQWEVPLENTSYLSDIKKYWDTYGQAKDVLERVNIELSSDTTSGYGESMEPMKKASENLQEKLWKDADDCDGLQEATESLAGYLQ